MSSTFTCVVRALPICLQIRAAKQIAFASRAATRCVAEARQAREAESFLCTADSNIHFEHPICLLQSAAPLRPALSAGLDAFPLYHGHRVFLWNAALRRNLGFLLRVQFDLIAFSTVFLSQHWGGAEHFARVTQRLRDVKRLDAVKIAFPQDEFYCADLYSKFYRMNSASMRFTALPGRRRGRISIAN